jgi:D-ribose pyranase
MKRRGLLNGPLLSHLGRLGHTDLVVVADCGLPVPRHVPVVDLAVSFGTPTFVDVLDVLLDEIVVESAVAAREIDDGPVNEWLGQRADGLGGPVTLVDHERLKEIAGGAAVVVRTGEATPYANVLLRCGVPF